MEVKRLHELLEQAGLDMHGATDAKMMRGKAEGVAASSTSQQQADFKNEAATAVAAAGGKARRNKAVVLGA
jgi:hypothetical protein